MIAKFARALLYPFSYSALMGRVLLRTFVETWRERDKGKQLFYEEVIKQLYFTGVQALPIVALISLIIGIGVGFQVSFLFQQLGRREFLDRIFFVFVVRELAPLVTSLVVLARSGSAICTEFSTNIVNDEIDIYQSQGINIYRILIFPRIVGVTFAIFVLSTLFSAVSCVSGAMILSFQLGTNFLTVAQGIITQGNALTILFFVGQTIVSGLVISLICSVHGLRAKSGSPEIPRAVSTALIHSLFGIVIVSLVKFMLTL